MGRAACPKPWIERTPDHPAFPLQQRVSRPRNRCEAAAYRGASLELQEHAAATARKNEECPRPQLVSHSLAIIVFHPKPGQSSLIPA